MISDLRTQKRQKTSEDQSQFFLSGEASAAPGDKANKSEMWDENEKNFLDEVTLNFMDDEEVMKNTKGKTVMKWDKVKKRYTLQKVDREGKVIQRNEAGVKIKKTDKQVDYYKRWQQKTHLSLQKTGELEDKKLIGQAKSASESRQLMKSFKGRHKDLMKGEDVRDNRGLMERKSKQMFEKIKHNKSAIKKRDKDGKRIYSEKA
jgi:hypothetical protein